MPLWHPGQGLSDLLQQSAHRRFLLHQELSPDRERQLQPAVGTADHPLLSLNGTTAPGPRSSRRSAEVQSASQAMTP